MDASPTSRERGGAARWPFVALLGVPLICGLALIAFAYRAYTDQRQRYFTQSYVRSLASLAEQAEGAVDGIVSALDRAVKDAERRDGLDSKSSLANLVGLIAESMDSVPVSRAAHVETFPAGGEDPAPGVDAFLRVRPDVARLRQTGDGMPGEPSRRREALVETADAHLQVCRRVPMAYQPRTSCRQAAESRQACDPWVCVEETVSEVLRPYLRGSALARVDTFVVDGTGRVLFERGNAGLRLARLPQAPPAADGARATPTAVPERGLPTLSEVQAATLVRTIKLDGTSYQLFSQPLRLGTDASATEVVWAIGILVPLDQAADDAHRLPLVVLLGVPLLLAAALLVLPFAQLSTIGGREPLSQRTVIGVAVGLVVTPGLLVLVGLAWLTYSQARARFDHEQQVFAAELEGAFSAELAQAEATLHAFSDRRREENEKAANAARPALPRSSAPAWGWEAAQRSPRRLPRRCEYLACTSVLDTSSTCHCEYDDGSGRSGRDTVSPSPRGSSHGFPYASFQMLVLADAAGRQVEKWATGKHTTARIDTSLHSAFKDVRDRRLLTLPGSERRYSLNVMASPNTGEVLSVLSIPIAAPGDAFAGVASMVADFDSVSEAVAPPDLTFALIDAAGRVLFHSADRRRLYENLFAEMAGGLPARAALDASRAEFVDLEYHGRPHRALVHPLPDSDWTLVVLRDKDALRWAIGEAAMVALTLPLAMVAAALLALVLTRLLLGPVALEALLPDPRATPRYWLLLIPLTFALGWTIRVMRSDDTPIVVLASLVAALTALAGTLLTLIAGRSRSTRRWLVGVAAFCPLLLAGAWLSWARSPLDVSLWLAVAAGFCVALGGWEPSWLPRPGRCEPRTVQGYTTVVVLLTLQIGALPTAALFLDAVGIQLEALMRARQIGLAEAMMAAEQRFAHRHDDRRSEAPRRATPPALPTWPGHTAFQRMAEVYPLAPRDELDLGLPEPLLAWVRNECASASGGPIDDTWSLPGDRCRLLRRALTGPILAALPIWTESAHDMRFRLYERSSDATWQAEAGRVSIAPPDRMPPPVGREVTLPAWDLRPAMPAGILARLALAALGGLLVVGLWRVVAWVVAKLFTLDVWETSAPQRGVAGARGGYYVRPTLATLATLRRCADQVIDLGVTDGPEDVPMTSSGTARRVLVLHLEHQLDDPVWNKRKRMLLEDLLLRRTVTVDVVSDIDVLAYFARRLHSYADPASEASYLAAGEMARWARALALLDKQRADLPPAPQTPRPGEIDTLREECRWTPRLRGIRRAIVADRRWTGLSAAALVAHIADLADAHYRVIWAQLTDEERLVLYHLAVRGIINPKNAELARRLMRRGLLRRTPALRVMNESFRLFVSRVEDRATIRAWERAAGASVWIWLRNGVLACAVVGAVVLFVTQPESYARWVALLTAVTTLGGGLAQLIGLFRVPHAATTA